MQKSYTIKGPRGESSPGPPSHFCAWGGEGGVGGGGFDLIYQALGFDLGRKKHLLSQEELQLATLAFVTNEPNQTKKTPKKPTNHDPSANPTPPTWVSSGRGFARTRCWRPRSRVDGWETCGGTASSGCEAVWSASGWGAKKNMEKNHQTKSKCLVWGDGYTTVVMFGRLQLGSLKFSCKSFPDCGGTKNYKW